MSMGERGVPSARPIGRTLRLTLGTILVWMASEAMLLQDGPLDLRVTTAVVAFTAFYTVLHLGITKYVPAVNPWVGALLAIAPIVLVYVLGGAIGRVSSVAYVGVSLASRWPSRVSAATGDAKSCRFQQSCCANARTWCAWSSRHSTGWRDGLPSGGGGPIQWRSVRTLEDGAAALRKAGVNVTRPADTTETHFEEQGSLPKPRLVGRMVRLSSGVLLLWPLYTMLTDGVGLMSGTAWPRGWTFWLLVAIAFYFTPYVVDIGFGLNWRRKPQYFVAVGAALLLVVDLGVYGSWWAPPLGVFVWAWLVYFSAHLGISFVLSTLLGTPGCEMRAIPHLWTVLTGRSTKEHYCPGPLDRLDQWETGGRKA